MDSNDSMVQRARVRVKAVRRGIVRLTSGAAGAM
jgi:hypothetical protein